MSSGLFEWEARLRVTCPRHLPLWKQDFMLEARLIFSACSLRALLQPFPLCSLLQMLLNLDAVSGFQFISANIWSVRVCLGWRIDGLQKFSLRSPWTFLAPWQEVEVPKKNVGDSSGIFWPCRLSFTWFYWSRDIGSLCFCDCLLWLLRSPDYIFIMSPFVNPWIVLI